MRRFYNISAKNMRNSDWQSRVRRGLKCLLHRSSEMRLLFTLSLCSDRRYVVYFNLMSYCCSVGADEIHLSFGRHLLINLGEFVEKGKIYL